MSGEVPDVERGRQMKSLLILLFTAQLLFACEPTITYDSLITVYDSTTFQIEGKTGGFAAWFPHYRGVIGYPDTVGTIAYGVDSLGVEWLKEGCYRITLYPVYLCTSSIVVRWYDVPLPVELLRFWVEPFPDHIILYWEVANESEGIYYQLFRNGLILADMPGGRRNYEYRDRTAQPGGHKYYLACVENGRREFLDSVTVLYGQDMQAAEPSMECHAGTIELKLPQATEVKLMVYNILGQRVVVLADSYFQSGTHQFRFDGSSYPSGIYLVRGSFDGAPPVTRKMSLVK